MKKQARQSSQQNERELNRRKGYPTEVEGIQQEERKSNRSRRNPTEREGPWQLAEGEGI